MAVPNNILIFTEQEHQRNLDFIRNLRQVVDTCVTRDEQGYQNYLDLKRLAEQGNQAKNVLNNLLLQGSSTNPQALLQASGISGLPRNPHPHLIQSREVGALLPTSRIEEVPFGHAPHQQTPHNSQASQNYSLYAYRQNTNKHASSSTPSHFPNQQYQQPQSSQPQSRLQPLLPSQFQSQLQPRPYSQPSQYLHQQQRNHSQSQVGHSGNMTESNRKYYSSDLPPSSSPFSALTSKKQVTLPDKSHHQKQETPPRQTANAVADAWNTTANPDNAPSSTKETRSEAKISPSLSASESREIILDALRRYLDKRPNINLFNQRVETWRKTPNNDSIMILDRDLRLRKDPGGAAFFEGQMPNSQVWHCIPWEAIMIPKTAGPTSSKGRPKAIANTVATPSVASARPSLSNHTPRNLLQQTPVSVSTSIKISTPSNVSSGTSTPQSVASLAEKKTMARDILNALKPKAAPIPQDIVAPANIAAVAVPAADQIIELASTPSPEPIHEAHSESSRAGTPLFLPSPSHSLSAAFNISDDDDDVKISPSKSQPPSSVLGKRKNRPFVDIPAAPYRINRRRIGVAGIRTPNEDEEDVDPNDFLEDEAISEACSRLRIRVCHWSSCGAKLNSADTLQLHLRAHIKETGSVECQWKGCTRSFTNERDIIEHSSMHSDLPFFCPFKNCKAAFLSAHRLVKHKVLEHINDTLQKSHIPQRLPLCAVPASENVVPSFNVIPRTIKRTIITKERHAVIGPRVLQNMMCNVKRSAATALDVRKSGRYAYDFLKKTSSHTTHPSRPVARNRRMHDLESSRVSECAYRIVLWPGPDAQKSSMGFIVKQEEEEEEEGVLDSREEEEEESEEDVGRQDVEIEEEEEEEDIEGEEKQGAEEPHTFADEPLAVTSISTS